MDYFFNNPEAFIPHGDHGNHDNLPEVVSSASSSSQFQIIEPIFEYGNVNTAIYQATDQTWAPVDLGSLVDFDGDELQVAEPGNTSTSTDGEKGERESTKLRRRAQNRASQRAFRERKDRHLKGLEYQLDHLNSKHQDLMQSYMKQSESVIKLNARLTELRVQVRAIKTQQRLLSSAQAAAGTGPVSHSNKRHMTSQEADSFDAFSFHSRQLFSLDDERDSSSLWSNVTHSNSSGQTPDDPVTDLPAFEDLLQFN